MGLNRMKLRQAVVDLLTNGGEPPYPTIAGPLVFDSRLDPLEALSSDAMVPVIIVYTDDDTSKLLDTASGRGANAREVTLTLEIAVGSYARDVPKDELPADPVFKLISTDPEVEVMLDILEAQLKYTINDPLNERADALQAIVKRWETWTSTPGRTSDKTTRISMRTIAVNCCIAEDCLPPVVFEGDTIPDALDEDTPLLDAPYLRHLSNAIKTEPQFEGVRDLLTWAKGGPPPPGRVLKKGLRIVFTADTIDPADPNRLAALGRTEGPDGRVEYRFEIKP